jgi:hypothetical protein
MEIILLRYDYLSLRLFAGSGTVGLSGMKSETKFPGLCGTIPFSDPPLPVLVVVAHPFLTQASGARYTD